MARYVPDPGDDLPGFIAVETTTGERETDPYGYAMAVIGTTLAFALDDGISGAMSEGEYRILGEMASIIAGSDPASYDQFMGTVGPR